MENLNRLFVNHQQSLLKIANAESSVLRKAVRRQLLGIPDSELSLNKNIAGIVDNAYIVRTGKKKFDAAVRCYPVFAKRLKYSLTSVDIAKDWFAEKKRNIEIYRPLPNYLGLLNYAGLLKDNRFPQIFLDDSGDIFSGAGDGDVTKADSTNWATTRGAASGQSFDYTATLDYSIGRTQKYAGSVYAIGRGFFPYSLAAFGPMIVSAGTHKTTSQTRAISGTYNVGLVLATQASPTALVLGDFSAITLNTPDEGAARVAPALSGVNTWTLNANGYAWIAAAAGDWLKLGQRNAEYDIDNGTPGDGTEYNYQCRMSEYAGTSSDPLLNFTFTPVAGGSGNMFPVINAL